MQKKLSLSLFALMLASCGQVSIPNTTHCTVAGVLNAGAICVETLNPKSPVQEKTLYEFIEFLEPKDATEIDPARGGAICTSSKDFAKQKTAIEQACALLKKRGGKCLFEIEQTIKQMNKIMTLSN